MKKTTTIISWNVNGLRAAVRKGFLDFMKEHDPDILCLQETKAMQDQVELDLPDYEEYWHSAEKKGYSGTAIFSKQPAISVVNGIGKKALMDDHERDAATEGRAVTAEYKDFFVVSVYTPNAKDDLARLRLRHEVWDPAFLAYVKKLEKKKPVIFCGDLNVAHKEIDLARPKENRGKKGFTDEEREGIDNIMKAGFLDSLREIHGEEPELYTWWSHWGKARERNVGWRIDYVFISPKLRHQLKDAFILPQVTGSDHCPVGIVLRP